MLKPISLMALLRLCALACVLSVGATAAMAQDTPAAREAAVDRYLRAVPMQKMMDDMVQGMAKNIPDAQRDRFVADMRSVIRIDVLEQITRSSMARTFTAVELNALADFYGSPAGASAMAKMGPYMAEVMPAIMAEVQRGIQDLQQRR